MMAISCFFLNLSLLVITTYHKENKQSVETKTKPSFLENSIYLRVLYKAIYTLYQRSEPLLNCFPFSLPRKFMQKKKRE
ncbi:hypothetical protein BD560DRAFT_406650 [Blakeslea trispora]|nr:hypothetical protein BD560DRAFT_406650 [Blakeslea trispora]